MMKKLVYSIEIKIMYMILMQLIIQIVMEIIKRSALMVKKFFGLVEMAGQ